MVMFMILESIAFCILLSKSTALSSSLKESEEDNNNNNNNSNNNNSNISVVSAKSNGHLKALTGVLPKMVDDRF